MKTLTNHEATARLKEVAGKIEALRVTHGLSKPQLILEYGALGDKQGGAYHAALSGVMNKRNPHTLLERFEGVLTQLTARKGGVIDPLYADLPHVVEFMGHVGQLAAQRGIKRLIIVRGPSGAGKSSLLKLVEKARPGEVLRLTAEVGWRSFHHALGEMLKALGVPEVTGPDKAVPGLDRLIGCAARSALLREKLLSRRWMVCLDEGQNVPGDFLSFLKDAINAAADAGAGLCFVIAAQDALWKKLAREAPEEMRQLRHNRLYLEYVMPGAEVPAAREFLNRRIPGLSGSAQDMNAAAGELIRMAEGGKGKPDVGVWAFLRNVADVAAELGDTGAGALREIGAEVYHDMTGRRWVDEGNSNLRIA